MTLIEYIYNYLIDNKKNYLYNIEKIGGVSLKEIKRKRKIKPK